MSKANAQRVVNVINRAIEKNTSDGARHSYKPAVAITSGSQFISAYVAGETEYASEDIRVPAGAYVGAGDYIIVGFSGEGKSWVNEILPYADYAKLVLDYNQAQIKIGDGTSEPSAGEAGQVILSGGPTLPAYWSDNFADTVRVPVKNNTGSTLTAGTAVYINGVSGQIPTVTKASASAESTSSKTLGIISKDINDTDQGTATTFGILKNVNTVGYSSGDNIWLSTVSGQWTTTRPSAPDHAVHLGYVITGGSASAGRIFVYIQNGFELGELHNVRASAPEDGQVLVYDYASSYWKPGTASSVAALNDLTDVVITSAANGNILSYNGTSWVNSVPSGTTQTGTKVVLTSSQSIGDAATAGDVAVNFSSSNASEYWDVSGWHDDTNPTRITPNIAGKMLVVAQVSWAAGTLQRWAYLAVNGTPTTGQTIGRTTVQATANGVQTYFTTAGWYDFNGSSDYVELYVRQNSGGALNLLGQGAGNAGTALSVHLIGGVKGDTGLTGSTGATGPGVAAGGTSGQYLKKNSASNYDTTWYTLLGSTAPSTQAFADAADAGTSLEAAHVDHKHAMPANPVTAHEAAADPHTGYLQESVVSGFATSAITLSDTATAGTGTTAIRSNAAIAAFDATNPSTQAIGDSASIGVAAYAARRDHKHALPGFGTITAQTSFGGSSGDGVATTIARSDHTHGTPANPVTAHEAAADPHTGYQKESEKAAANGYASLDASTLVPIAQIPTGTSGTTVSLGNHTHAGSGVSTVSSSGTATTISNTTTETDLWSFTVPANSLGSNGFVKVNMFGTMLNNSGANRAYTIRVYYGATKIFDDALSNIGANASSRAWSMELTLGAANSTSSQVLAGYIAVSAVTNSTTGTGDLNTADTITQRTFYGTSAENSTGDLTFRVSIQFPANTATQTWTRSYGMAITD